MKPHPIQIHPPSIARWAPSSVAPYVHERQGPLPGPEVLITALVHGNEYSGAIVTNELLASGWQPTRGRVTFAFCNVAAFDCFDAAQPDTSRLLDEDFNRVWGTARLASSQASLELARARQLVPFVERATHLLDLHSMHEAAAPLWITGRLQRNIDFAQGLQTPYQVIIDNGHEDGVRMRDHGEFSNPASQGIALLLEAGQHWQATSVSVAKNAMFRFLVHAGAMTNSNAQKSMAGWWLPDCTPSSPIVVTDRIVARSMDFAFTQPYSGGEVIAKAGTVIATDSDLQIVTPYDNCVLVMPSLRQLRTGVTTVRLGQRVASP